MNVNEASLVAIFLPLAGALAIVFAGRVNENLREAVTLVTAMALIWVVWGMLGQVMAGEQTGIGLGEIVPGITIAFRVEPLGMLFAALASGLWLVNSIYSIGYMRGNREKNQTRFYVYFSIAIAATMGIAFASNLFTLFLFYELLTLSTYPLVAHKGDQKSMKGARTYLGVLLATSIGLLLPAIIWTYLIAGTGEFTPGGILSGNIAGGAVGLLLALFVFGTGKAALMPVHRWLPAAMVAPTPVSALLHAVAVVKAGVFTLTKIIIYIFGIDFLSLQAGADWLLYAAAFTIIVASLVALRQHNLKRLLAYSTIAQLSYVVMAASILRPLAEIGAAFHITAHALGKITLFFAVGAIYTASKKTEIQQLRGLGRRMPWTMAAFTIAALSMIGVPPTGGFVSKWYILGGAIEADSAVAVFTIIISTALNAAYFLPIIYLAWFAKETAPPTVDHGEAPMAAVIALTTTAALTLVLFFFNGPVIDLIQQIEWSGP